MSATAIIDTVCIGQVVKVGVDANIPNGIFNWTIDSEDSIKNFWGDSIAIAFGDRPGIRSIKVEVHSPEGCASDPKTASVYVMGEPLELPDQFGFCYGDSVLIASGDNYTSYAWSNGQMDSKIYASNPGVLSLTVEDQYHCISSDSTEIVVYPNPKVHLDRLVELTPGSSIMLDAGNDGVYYKWSDGSISPVLHVDDNDYSDGDEISVLVENEYGCVTGDTARLYRIEETLFGLPNAFSPNGDGLNDELLLLGQTDYIRKFEIGIYNRFGKLVFSTKNMNVGWNGTYENKPLDPDVFSYFMKIEYYNGKTEIKSGNVTLVR